MIPEHGSFTLVMASELMVLMRANPRTVACGITSRSLVTAANIVAPRVTTSSTTVMTLPAVRSVMARIES